MERHSNYRVCKKCGSTVFIEQLDDNFYICPVCGEYFLMPARDRIDILSDINTFHELYAENYTYEYEAFPQYISKLEDARSYSKENEAVICGTCDVLGQRCLIFVMEPFFMMGSMGRVSGEKIALCFEYGMKEELPIVGVCSSSGVRVQEGVKALVQMVKVMEVYRKYSLTGNMFISLLSNHTLGGVAASFAMSADIILAEPNAIIGLTGKKIIKHFDAHKADSNFQNANVLIKNGSIDCIVERQNQREVIAALLSIKCSKR